jgi:hypothetical protein
MFVPFQSTPNLHFRKPAGLIPADFQGLQSVKYQIHLKKTSFTFPCMKKLVDLPREMKFFLSNGVNFEMH